MRKFFFALPALLLRKSTSQEDTPRSRFQLFEENKIGKLIALFLQADKDAREKYFA